MRQISRTATPEVTVLRIAAPETGDIGEFVKRSTGQVNLVATVRSSADLYRGETAGQIINRDLTLKAGAI